MQLAHFETTVQDTNGTAQADATVQIYREGATVAGNQSITSGQAVTVRSPGKLKNGDVAFINTTTGTTYTVGTVTDTTVVLSGFGGTLNLANLDQIIPSNNQPTIYTDSQGGASTSFPLDCSTTGYADCYLEFADYDYIVTNGATLTLFKARLVPTEAPAQIRYADAFAKGSSTLGLQEAIDDLPSTGGMVIGPGVAGTLLAGVTVAANVEVVSQGRGVIITKGANGAMFTLGAKSALRNFSLDGNKAALRTGVGVAITSANAAEVTGCEIINCQGIGIDIDTSNQVRIEGNRISACNGNGIYWENNSDDVICRGNYVSSTTNAGAHCIAAHGTTSAQTCHRAIIEGNSLVIGTATGFGIELGAFSGATALGPVIRGNTILASATHGGGIYLDTVTGGVVAGNYYNASAQTASIAGIRLVTCDSVDVSHNSVIGGTTINAGIKLADSSNCIVDANMINGWNSSGTDAGLSVKTATTSANCRRNRISNNTLLATGSGSQHAIHVQANATTSDASDNLIQNNHIIGNSAAGFNGVRLELTTGTLDGVIVQGNKITSCGVGILLSAAALDEISLLSNDVRGNTTAITNSSTATVRQFGNITAANQAGPAFGAMTDIVSATTITLLGGGFYRLTGGVTLETINTGVDGTLIFLTASQNTTINKNGNLTWDPAGEATQTLGTTSMVPAVYSATTSKWILSGFD